MAQPGERRFTFRLYEDNPVDMELLEKLDRLLVDGRFRSKNEVLRKGIALVYEACYEVSGTSQVSAGLTQHEIREASSLIAKEILSRIGGSITRGVESRGLSEEPGRITDEMASFLSELNSDG